MLFSSFNLKNNKNLNVKTLRKVFKYSIDIMDFYEHSFAWNIIT